MRFIGKQRTRSYRSRRIMMPSYGHTVVSLRNSVAPRTQSQRVVSDEHLLLADRISQPTDIVIHDLLSFKSGNDEAAGGVGEQEHSRWDIPVATVRQRYYSMGATNCACTGSVTMEMNSPVVRLNQRFRESPRKEGSAASIEPTHPHTSCAIIDIYRILAD